MAEDVVIARFRADLDQVKKEFDEYIKVLDKTEKKEEELQKETAETGKVALTAGQKRANALKAEQSELKRLQTARKQAFSVKELNEFDQKISKVKGNIATLGGGMQSASTSIKSSLVGIGAGIAAAFSIQAVIAFGKASVDAFLDAEKNAAKLKFAITTIGGESEAAFNKLIKQSAEVQKISIFSDDSIQNAQAALSAFGLTSDQIEKLIPKLADFATVTGVDIAQAAEQVGAGLEGAGREFKKYEIEVSATASRQENFNAILGGFSKFAGSAEAATKTLSGSLAQQRNIVDDLQEEIGAKLAPSFVKIQLAATRALKSIVDLFGEKQQTVVEQATEKFTKIGVEFNNLIDTLKRGNLTTEGRKTLIEEINKEYGEYLPNLLTEKSTLEEINTAQKAVNEQLKNRIILVALEEDIVRITKNAAIAARDLLEVEKARTKAQKELSDNSLLTLNTTELLNNREKIALALLKTAQDELGGLTESYKKLSEQLGLTTTDLNKLNKVEPQTEDQKKALEKAAEELKKNQELLRQLQIKNIADEKQRRIAAFEDEVKGLTAQGQLRADIIKELEKQLVADLNEIDLKRNVDPLFRAKPKASPTTPTKIAAGSDSSADSGVDDDIEKLKELEDVAKETRDKIISSTQDLVGTLTSLYQQLAQNQIDAINRVKDEQLAAIDTQLEANDVALDKRRISVTEAEAVEKRLAAEKIRIEQEADKKTRDIKRKQAIADKAAALAQIAINTAVAISSAIGPQGVVLIPLYAALGAAQAALVLAQPIPYKKGTKAAKGGLSLVGEEGPELMMLPKDSKVVNARNTSKYADAINAMQDDKFEDYVFRTHITPELEKQKLKHSEDMEKSFAKNISQSLVLQMAQGGKGDFYLQKMSRSGIAMNNVDELASAIASKITQDIYRR